MPSTTTTVLASLTVVIGLLSGYVYLFGIPPALKRYLEEQALEKMGENKASYLAKDVISKVPASDQQEVKDLKERLGGVVGGGLQNPLGKFTGETADDATRDFTGR